MKNLGLILVGIGTAWSLMGCGGEGSSFSLLADSDTFQQSAGEVNSDIDILWVIDNSGSMKSSQDELAANFSSFIQDFQTKNLNFKMAITGTNAFQHRYWNSPLCVEFRDGPVRTNFSNGDCAVEGTHNGQRILTPTTPNLANVFINNIKQGVNGSGDERPFMSIQDVMNHAPNSGFLRSNSFFAVIIVSDEDDTSWNQASGPLPHGDSRLHNPSIYRDYLDTLTGSASGSRRYSVNTVSIPDQACVNQLSTPSWNGQVIGYRNQALATMTGGFNASLCGDFATELKNMADNILSLATQFYLTRIPKPETIVVTVNGVVIPNKDTNGGQGWEYIPSTNSIRFTPTYIPAAGSEITVDFDPVSYGS